VNEWAKESRSGELLEVGARWPTRAPVAAANALQFHVSQLRKVLGDSGVIVTQEPGYLMRVDPDQLDLLRFERLVAEAGGAEAARASRLLTEALSLWRGDPLADLADDPTSQAEIQRLQAARLAALELRIGGVPRGSDRPGSRSPPRRTRPCVCPGGRARVVADADSVHVDAGVTTRLVIPSSAGPNKPLDRLDLCGIEVADDCAVLLWRRAHGVGHLG
jgi:hypothetical protein